MDNLTASTPSASSNSSPVFKAECHWTDDPDTESAAGAFMELLDLFLFPLLLFLTTTGNILNLLVLFREKSVGTKNCYLITIAFVDMIFMWCALWTYIVNYDEALHGTVRPSVKNAFDCMAGLVMFLQETCCFASSWLIVAFSLERLLAIRYPLQYLSRNNGKRSLFSVIGVLGIAVIFSLVRLVDYYWFYNNFLRFDPKPKIRPSRPPLLMQWYKSYLSAEVVVQLATFVTILCLNGLLLLTIIHQRQRRQNTLQAVPSGDASAKADWFALPMLGACVILYLITQLPGFFGSILYLLEKACYSQKSSQWQGALRPLQNICTNLYFSINFLLYCGVNARFRDTLAKLSRSLMRKIAILVRPVLDKRRSSDDSGKSTVTVTKPVSATTNLSSSL